MNPSLWFLSALMVTSIQDELGSAMHDLFDEKCAPRAQVAPTPPQNLTSVNWMDLLEPTSRIPPDVAFKLIKQPNNNEGEGEEKVLGEVKAHKYFLAATSDTFKSLFFGHRGSQSCQEAEEVLDYCENKSDGSDDKFTMRSNEPVEVS